MYTKLLKKVHCMVESITGEKFYIAGGAVVDALYNRKPKDYDMVLCEPNMSEREAFHFLEALSERFEWIGCSTKIYQSYNLNIGEEVNPTSFQAMFLGCMKVNMANCQLDILISKAPAMTEHVLKHDCNMNMVWFNGERICWEHGGNTPYVTELVFNPDVCDARINRMGTKRHELISSFLS